MTSGGTGKKDDSAKETASHDAYGGALPMDDSVKEDEIAVHDDYETDEHDLAQM